MSKPDIAALLTEQGRAVIAGVLRYPDTWPRVSGLVGDVLAPKSMRASKWTTTAWLALSQLVEASAAFDVLVLREKMQGLAQAGRPELLDAWTPAEDEQLRQVVNLIDFVTQPTAVVDAAERLVTTYATHEFSRNLVTAQRELIRDPLADPFAAMSALQERLQTTCRRTCRVPLSNAVEQTREALAATRTTVLPTGFDHLDRLSGGGQDLGEVTLLGGRTGAGKSTLLQALARNQIFPGSAAPMRNAKERLAVNTDERRPYILGVWCENLKRMFYERLACDMLDIDASDMRRERQAALDRNNTDAERVHSDEYLKALEQYGRLTVIDEDDLPNISVLAVTSAIEGWIERVLSTDPDATMLVLVDYWQRTDPDEEHVREQRTRQLELAAKRLKQIVRNRPVALTLAAQINDSFDNEEPQRSDIRDCRGGNNEAGNIWLMHRWSNAQRDRIRERFPPGEARTREQCMTLFSDKGRSSEGGWRAIFNFDGAHYRITDAAVAPDRNTPTNWLRDYDTIDMIKPDKRAKDAAPLTMGTHAPDKPATPFD